MGKFKEVLPNEQGWIHELARAEIHPEAEKLLQLGKSFDPQQLVEESTVEFLTQLREYLEEYAKVFNSYSEYGKKFSEVKIYSIAQSPADFMVFRNQVKLVVTNTDHGVIQLTFAHHIQNSLSVNGYGQHTHQDEGSSMMGAPQELIAQLGPFRDVYWTYQGEKVQPEQVAKFYFSEFIRATRQSGSSKVSQELLLEQIKDFLQEKGLDL